MTVIVVFNHETEAFNQSNIVNFEDYCALADAEKMLWMGKIGRSFSKADKLALIAA